MEEPVGAIAGAREAGRRGRVDAARLAATLSARYRRAPPMAADPREHRKGIAGLQTWLADLSLAAARCDMHLGVTKDR